MPWINFANSPLYLGNLVILWVGWVDSEFSSGLLWSSWDSLLPNCFNYLCKNHRKCEEDGEDPDHQHHLPAVAQGADWPGVHGVDYHHKPLQGDSSQVEYCCCGGQHSAGTNRISVLKISQQISHLKYSEILQKAPLSSSWTEKYWSSWVGTAIRTSSRSDSWGCRFS